MTIERRELEVAGLKAHFYSPAGGGKFPTVIAIHGGGWRLLNLDNYRYLGPWLAERGYALLAVTYRLATAERKTYPEAVDDVRSALKFARGDAKLGIDARRISGSAIRWKRKAASRRSSRIACCASCRPRYETPFLSAGVRHVRIGAGLSVARDQDRRRLPRGRRLGSRGARGRREARRARRPAGRDREPRRRERRRRRGGGGARRAGRLHAGDGQQCQHHHQSAPDDACLRSDEGPGAGGDADGESAAHVRQPGGAA